MTARTVPTMPSWLAGQKITAAALNSITTYAQFWANPPMFHMYQSVAQTLTTGVFAAIIMDTFAGPVGYDTDSCRSSTTPFPFIVPAGMSGRWELTWKVGIVGNATGVRAGQLNKNGGFILDSEELVAAASTSSTYPSGSITVSLTAGDSVNIQGFQNSGGNLNTDLVSPSYLQGRLVSLATP